MRPCIARRAWAATASAQEIREGCGLSAGVPDCRTPAGNICTDPLTSRIRPSIDSPLQIPGCALDIPESRGHEGRRRYFCLTVPGGGANVTDQTVNAFFAYGYTPAPSSPACASTQDRQFADRLFQRLLHSPAGMTCQNREPGCFCRRRYEEVPDPSGSRVGTRGIYLPEFRSRR